MAQKLFLDYAGLSRYDVLLKTLIDTKDAEILRLAKEYADGLGDNYEAAGSVASAREALEKLISDNSTAIDALEASLAEGGTTSNAIKAALEAAQAAQKTADDNAADIEALGERVDALETDMGNVDDLSTTNKTVVTAINEVLASVGTSGTAAVVTMSTETTTEGMAKSYTIKQGDVTVGVIDIPKDLVVESGEVVSNPEGQEAGTYIKLKLANVEEPLYINVGSLVDIYKAKANAAQVQVAIDSATREISASIVAESITATELAADSVTTVKIADKNVTKAKLSEEVQTSLGKADVAEANAKAHADDLNEAMDERVQAIETALGSEGSVDSKIATAKQEAIDAAAADAESKASAAETAAKEYADGLNTAMDTRVDTAESDIDALEASLAENGATYNSIVDAKKAGTDAQAYAEGVQDNLDESNGRIDALEGLVGEGCGAIETASIESLFSTNA